MSSLPEFHSRWLYRSFRPKEGARSPADPTTIDRLPELAANWADSAILDVVTDAEGRVLETLTIIPGKLVLNITGNVTPGDGGKALPGITLAGEAGPSKNTIRDCCIPGTTVIVGTTLATQGEPALAPDGTVGPFVLVKQ